MSSTAESSSAMESTTDTHVLDAPQRPRWKKALSLGSVTSTERCTDLDELDMEALAADGALTRNPRTGVYSGWVHVATAGTGRVAFEKRFCRLEELVCKFYAEERDFEQRIRPVNRHVIISVRRVHSRNKTFVFTDYEDRTVMLHTTMGADFELWYGTFAAIVKETQVAKTRGTGRNPRRATTTTPTANGAYRRQASADDAQRLRALTAPTFFASTSWLRSDRPQDELPPIVVDEDDPERTHTAWFYMEAPWWRKLLLSETAPAPLLCVFRRDSELLQRQQGRQARAVHVHHHGVLGARPDAARAGLRQSPQAATTQQQQRRGDGKVHSSSAPLTLYVHYVSKTQSCVDSASSGVPSTGLSSSTRTSTTRKPSKNSL